MMSDGFTDCGIDGSCLVTKQSPALGLHVDQRPESNLGKQWQGLMLVRILAWTLVWGFSEYSVPLLFGACAFGVHVGGFE